MSLMKKMLFIPMVVTTPVAAIAMTTSCTVPHVDEDLASQLEILTSDAAKNIYSNAWSRDAFAELYLKSGNPTAAINKEEKQVIKKYLESLNKENPTLTEIQGKPIADVFADIDARLFQAYNFYVSWKTSSDLEYFIKQKAAWVEKNLSWIDPTTKVVTTIRDNFQAIFAYSASAVSDVQFKQDFDLLYKIIQTGIQTELLNMIVAEFYFTSATSEMIQRGTTYNKIIDGNVNTLTYWEATSFDINSPTYFLEKYLVTKSPKLKWNFASDSAEKIQNWQNRLISTTQDYHDLWIDNGDDSSSTTSAPTKIFNKDLLINSNDLLFNASALGFYGYNPALELSSTTGEGDLSVDADTLRTFNSSKSGLFNSKTKKLVSYDALKSREKIDKLNATTPQTAFLPAVSINNLTGTIRKKSHQITQEDLIFNGTQSFTEGNKLIEGFNTWQVLDIIPILSNTTQQSIKIQMTYSYTNPATVDLNFVDYPYDVIVTWKQTPSPASSEIVSELSEKFYFNNDSLANTPFAQQNTSGINPIVEGKVNVTYYIRLLPNFIWDKEATGEKKIKQIDSKAKAIGKFSMAGTPWEKPTSTTGPNHQRTLAFYLYMNDAELIKEIKSVLVLNDIALRPGKVQEVNKILKELEILYISKKPSYAKPRTTS